MNIICELEKCLADPEEIQTMLVATDSEWDKNREDPWLSTAFASPKGIVFYVTKDIPEAIKFNLAIHADDLGVDLVYVNRQDDSDLLADALGRLGINGDVRLLIYFSPKDLEYAIGWEGFRTAIETNKVRQRNNLSGTLQSGGRKVYVKDLCGWAGKTSLKRFAGSLGVGTHDKGKMDDYKARMYEGMIEHANDYLKYSTSDASMLLELHEAFVGHFRTLQTECLDMGEADLWKPEDIPMTSGALVAKTLERWIHAQSSDLFAFKFCLRKLGQLDPDDRRYKSAKWAYGGVVSRYRTPEGLAADLAEADPPDDLGIFYGAKFAQTALDASSVKVWAARPALDSGGYNALVQGGRCLNENPYKYHVGLGADIDISGCYGESLRSLDYPIGLPSCWSSMPNQARIKFGNWLDKYGEDLVDGLWTATVSGQLGFDQDLIFSKLVKQSDIRKAAYQGGGDEESDIPGDFVMLRNEIQNGIITSDILKALKAVCTNTEWGDLRNLEVVTASAYLKSHRCESGESWARVVMADKGSCRSVLGNIQDDRTKAWFAIPLEGFIGRMYERRKFYKDLGKTAETEDERTRAAGMDAMLKLAVNVVYGVLASRYFPVGNTIVANSITARARLGVWMLCKSLGTRQSITDGGIYEPEKVAYFDPEYRMPGLDSLSKSWEWHAPNRRRWYKPMAGCDWRGEWPDLKTIDKLAFDHVERFWANYKLAFPFRLEHKEVFQGAAYWSKGDYALLRTDGKVRYAVRGKDKNAKNAKHPSFVLLDNILGGDDSFPDDFGYLHKGLMKVGKYNVVQNCKGYEALKGLRPGDDYTEERRARYNNNHFPLKDESDYKNRKSRKKTNRGKAVSWFEKYGQMGIQFVNKMMATNDLSKGVKEAV